MDAGKSERRWTTLMSGYCRFRPRPRFQPQTPSAKCMPLLSLCLWKISDKGCAICCVQRPLTPLSLAITTSSAAKTCLRASAESVWTYSSFNTSCGKLSQRTNLSLPILALCLAAEYVRYGFDMDLKWNAIVVVG